MKSGLTIVEMAQQIERQSKLKQDYLLDTRRLQVEPFGSQLYAFGLTHRRYPSFFI